MLQVTKIFTDNLQNMQESTDKVDIDAHVKDIKENMKWMTKYYQPMRQWFEGQTGAGDRRKIWDKFSNNNSSNTTSK